MKKNAYYITIAGILLLGLVSCSGGDSQFKQSVNSAIEKGENKAINRQLKRIFEEEYGWEKARQEAKQYCQELKQGKKRSEIFADRLFKYREKDSSGKKTTAKKGAYLKMIKIIIYESAENSYCPQKSFF